MNESAVAFPCGADHLMGILHLPTGCDSDTGVLVIVGGPQYRVGSHRQFVLTSRSLATVGFPVFRFDYRGMGDSTGPVVGFDEIDTDISAALDAFVNAHPKVSRVVLFGLCDAASAALMYCNTRDRRVAGLILANPWARTDAGQAEALVQHYYGRRLLQWSFWSKALRGNLRLDKVVKTFFSNLRLSRRRKSNGSAAAQPFLARMLAGLKTGDQPILVLIGERDLTAMEFLQMRSGSQEWRDALNSEKVTIKTLPDADHTFSDRAVLDHVALVCGDWLSRSFHT